MMLQIVGYLALLAVWTYVRVHSLLLKREPSAAFLYGMIMLICIVIGSLLMARVTVPSFNVPAEAAFRWIGRSLLKQ
ncbi:hypothetical protein [Paenibacillus rhizosphaerae]|nr:hypothetical protein [Paenibacillus rhizosphaerae]